MHRPPMDEVTRGVFAAQTYLATGRAGHPRPAISIIAGLACTHLMGGDRKMNAFLTRQIEDLMPVFLGDPPVGAAVDLHGQVTFIDDFMRAGAAEFKLLFFYCAFTFKLLASVMKLKPWSKLELTEKQAVAQKLYVSRNPLLRSVPVLCGLPLYISYFRRSEISVPLGFDAAALKAEANLRSVSRDRNLPPK